MIQTHHHDVATTAQAFTVIHPEFVVGPAGVTAAVNPDEHGTFFVVGRGSPDVDAQAIFGRLAVLPFEHE